MKCFFNFIFLIIICSNLYAQNPNRKKDPSHSFLNIVFQNSKVTAQIPQLMSGLEPTLPFFKVNQSELVKYQLDSLILNPSNNAIVTPKFKIDCKYDLLGRMILFYVSKFNDTTSKFDFNYKYSYKYGVNYSIRDEYESNNSMINFHRTKTIYDQNNKIQTIFEGSDSVSLDSYTSRDEYIYEDNLLSSKNSFYSNAVEPFEMIRYTYDSLKRDTAEFISYTVLNELKESEKVIYAYYDNNDICKSETFYFSGGNWIQGSKSDFSYNNSHDCISYIESDFKSSKYEESLKYISNYNESIMMSNVYYGATFNDFPYTFNTQIKKIDLYGKSGSESVLMGSYTFYYSERNGTMGVDNPSGIDNQMVRYNAELKTIVFQNPESVYPTTIQLFNLSGKMILNKQLSTSGSVSVVHLKGLYVYKFINSGKIVVGKILIQ